MKWYLMVFSKYAVFSGRARRKEYWMYALLTTLFLFAAAILDNILGITFKIGPTHTPYGYLYTLYGAGTFIPGLAVCVRRLHDIGKSGWFYVLFCIACFIPAIGMGVFTVFHSFIGIGICAVILLSGGIWFIVMLCKEGDAGDNKYGSNPKAFIEASMQTTD